MQNASMLDKFERKENIYIYIYIYIYIIKIIKVC
jgi:hypothetical protein